MTIRGPDRGESKQPIKGKEWPSSERGRQVASRGKSLPGALCAIRNISPGRGKALTKQAASFSNRRDKTRLINGLSRKVLQNRGLTVELRTKYQNTLEPLLNKLSETDLNTLSQLIEERSNSVDLLFTLLKNASIQKNTLQTILNDPDYFKGVLEIPNQLEEFNIDHETAYELTSVVFHGCNQQWLNAFNDFLLYPSFNEAQQLIKSAPKSPVVDYVLKQLLPFSPRSFIEEVQQGKIHKWKNKEPALTRTVPETPMLPFKNLAFVDETTLQEVRKGIEHPPHTFHHEIAIPRKSGGFQYSSHMHVEKIEDKTYRFSLTLGEQTLHYEVKWKKDPTDKQIKKALLLARSAWVREGV